MRTMLSTVLLGVVVCGCRQSPTYEESVQRLAAGTPREQIREALDVLDAGGKDAFPTLIRHFPDTAPAEPAFFQQEVMEIAPDGSMRDHLPTIGEACFGIFQVQIEGNWPKAYRTYYVLTPQNAQQWLDAHAGMTLAELRVAAAEESLKRAAADSAGNQPVYSGTLEFLRKHLQEARQGPLDGE